MRGDEETGTVIATQIVEEEGLSRDSNTNASGESGQGEFSAGEPGRDGSAGSTGKLCWRCVKHKMECIVLSSGA